MPRFPNAEAQRQQQHAEHDRVQRNDYSLRLARQGQAVMHPKCY